jgi:catechol 2,3-dioxygenase-like lactoylglutathione lyase family enzyme
LRRFPGTLSKTLRPPKTGCSCHCDEDEDYLYPASWFLVIEIPKMILSLHHVQLAMPRGREAEARAFYCDVLGMIEQAKPERLARRGGVWFSSGDAQVHLGVEDDFKPAKKAHPALLVASLETLIDRCVAAGFEVKNDEPLPGYHRAYVSDPFGNRIELLEPAVGG